MPRVTQSRRVTPLKIALVTSGMTVRQLADRIHRSEDSLSRWVNGRRTPDMLVKGAIARELDTTVDALWPEEAEAAA
jgi:transcriptional regulator with XRE-family HTH domain